MVKKNSKKMKKTGKRKVKSSKKKSSSRLGGLPSPVKDLVCSMANPFECSACIPDGTRGHGCFSIKEMGVIGTGTGTSCSVWVSPYPRGIYATDTGSAAATVTTPANWTACSALATVVAQYSAFRVVSFGLKISYIGNTATDNGVIVGYQVGYGPNVTLSALNGLSMSNVANATEYYKTYSLRSGCMITWRPQTSNNQALWLDNSNSALAATSQLSVPFIGVSVFAATANSQNLVQWELVVNYEGQYRSQQFLPGGLNVDGPTAMAVPGWFELALNTLSSVKPIVPLVASAVDALIPGGGTLVRGIGGFLGPGAMGGGSRTL